jgi:Dehydrogenases with different specificities (related to short-chain alcohol dehydrogenases)
MLLENKVILVTGGSGLIGKSIVKDAKSKGAIVINADINVISDPEAGTIKLDIADEKSISDTVDTIYKKFTRIDGLVNAAYPRTSDWGSVFNEVKLDSWRKNVDMQMNSVFYICQQVAKYMLIKQKGSIVNLASIYGIVGNDFSIYEGLNMSSAPAYSAIKGGIINFSRYLASYFGKKNIRVNCVSPGGIFDNQNPEFVRRYNEKVPLGRMGNPEDISPTVSFLLSDEAQYITGQNIAVDGGWTAI